MEESFKRLKDSEDGDGKDLKGSQKIIHQEKDDFSAVLSSCAHFKNNSITKSGDPKLFQTKNSINDHFGFQIKNGLSKLENCELNKGLNNPLITMFLYSDISSILKFKIPEEKSIFSFHWIRLELWKVYIRIHHQVLGTASSKIKIFKFTEFWDTGQITFNLRKRYW